MPKISVTVITFNEEANLPACLDSVRWVDEIVIVDSGSSDGTIEIAKKYTDKVLYHDWPGYAAQKNWAIEQAANDWILSLDADEIVPASLKEEIQDVLGSGSPCPGYYIPRKNFFLGRWIRYGGWYPDYTVRLFDKRKGRFSAREVHEAVHVTGNSGYLLTPMEHYTYKTLSDYQERVARYASLSALEMKREGKSFHRLDLWARPVWTFLRMYLLQQGFRDGVYGLLLAGFYGYYTFLKYAKLWEMEFGRSR